MIILPSFQNKNISLDLNISETISVQPINKLADQITVLLMYNK